MSKYGIPYQGSKSQIADDIIDNLPRGKRFVDLFVNLQKGKYGDTYNYQSEKALKFGIVESNSNTGSSTRLFYEEKLPEVLKVLKKNHFMK